MRACLKNSAKKKQSTYRLATSAIFFYNSNMTAAFTLSKNILHGTLLSLVFFFPFSLSAQQSFEQILSGLNPRTRAQIESNMSGLNEEMRAQVEQQVIASFSSGLVQSPADIAQEAIKKGSTFQTKPIYPGPYEEVTVTLVNFLADLGRADISWYLNGKLVTSGKGETEFTFTTGDAGAASAISVIAKTAEGVRIDQKMTVTPAEITIVWEAESYTPPFYKGKALLSPYTAYRLVAIPRFIVAGKTIPPSELVYTWRKNNEVVQKSSGYGKYTYRGEAPMLLWEDAVSVEVSSIGKSLNAYKKIAVAPALGTVLLYEDNPLEGVRYENAIGSEFNLADKELVVKAEPYFFARDDKESGSVMYDWKLNGANISGENDKITFRQEATGEGSAKVSIAIRNAVKTYQSAAAAFTLNFKSAGAFNF